MTKRAPLLVLLMLCAPALAEKNILDAMNRNVAGRVFLTSGDVVEVLYSTIHRTSMSETTLSMRDTGSGAVFTVAEKGDDLWKKTDTSISDGKTTIQVICEYGYYTDKLPTPVQVKIGKDVYRALLKPNALTDDQKKIQKAIGQLPAAFRAGLQHLVPLGTSSDFTTASLPILGELVEGAGAQLDITMTKKMEPAEIDALVRDATR